MDCREVIALRIAGIRASFYVGHGVSTILLRISIVTLGEDIYDKQVRGQDYRGEKQ
jgi:hypothetical protein